MPKPLRLYLVIGICTVLIIAAVLRFAPKRPDTVEFLGQTIRLKQKYQSWEAYKNDPNNIDSSDIAQVQKLVRETRLPSQVRATEFSQKVLSLQFPGYGCTAFRSEPAPDGSCIRVFAIEVPQADQDRYAVYREHDGEFTLLDDFLASDETNIMKVSETNGTLIYSDIKDKLLLQHPAKSKSN